jgi:hypothetical protein
LATIISTFIPPLLLFLFPISGVYSVSFFAIHLAESKHIGHPASAGLATLFLISLFLLLLAKSLKFQIPKAIFHWATVILLLVAMFASSLGMVPVPWI